MTPEQFVAIIGALTALIIAVTAAWVQLRATHQLVNGRMQELLQLTRDSSKAEGKLEGPAAPSSGASSNPVPSTPPPAI